jgi:hypothetical protein
VTGFSRVLLKNGGVAIFAHKRVSCEIEPITIPMVEEKIFECAACVCKSVLGDFVLIVLYRSPGSDFDTFIFKLDKLLNFIYNINRVILLTGDFNCDFLSKSPHNAELRNVFDSYGLTCLITEPTRVTSSSKTLLDNFTTNYDLAKTRVRTYDVGLSDHYMIECHLSKNKSSPPVSYLTTRVISDSNLNYLNHLLNKETWDEVYYEDSLDSSFDSFYQTFCSYFDGAIPIIRKKIPRRKNFKKPWLSDEIIGQSRKLRTCLCKASYLIHTIFTRNTLKQKKNIVC